MPKRPTFENLGKWLNPPEVQDRVIAYMDELGGPALLRELYLPLALPRSSVNRVLQRLHNKGIVMRWKIPRANHSGSALKIEETMGAVSRSCYLYQLVSQMDL